MNQRLQIQIWKLKTEHNESQMSERHFRNNIAENNNKGTGIMLDWITN